MLRRLGLHTATGSNWVAVSRVNKRRVCSPGSRWYRTGRDSTPTSGFHSTVTIAQRQLVLLLHQLQVLLQWFDSPLRVE